MNWVTVTSMSCFGWLCRASPSFAAKNIISLILILTIWWYVDSSLTLTSVFSWQNSVSLYPASFGTARPNLLVIPGYLLTSSFCIPVPYYEKDIVCVCVYVCVCVSSRYYVFTESINLSFFSISCWGINLDYCDVEWFALEMNRDNSVVFEIAPKYYILDSFVGYEGYSISSKGFLSTVVEVMIIWIKFAHSCPFQFTDC